jgi:hypothetical protein
MSDTQPLVGSGGGGSERTISAPSSQSMDHKGEWDGNWWTDPRRLSNRQSAENLSIEIHYYAGPLLTEVLSMYISCAAAIRQHPFIMMKVIVGHACVSDDVNE